jgi:hypothetical protein
VLTIVGIIKLQVLQTLESHGGALNSIISLDAFHSCMRAKTRITYNEIINISSPFIHPRTSPRVNFTFLGMRLKSLIGAGSDVLVKNPKRLILNIV